MTNAIVFAGLKKYNPMNALNYNLKLKTYNSK